MAWVSGSMPTSACAYRDCLMCLNKKQLTCTVWCAAAYFHPLWWAQTWRRLHGSPPQWRPKAARQHRCWCCSSAQTIRLVVALPGPAHRQQQDHLAQIAVKENGLGAYKSQARAFSAEEGKKTPCCPMCITHSAATQRALLSVVTSTMCCSHALLKASHNRSLCSHPTLSSHQWDTSEQTNNLRRRCGLINFGLIYSLIPLLP